jgi:hypothetical protein
MCHGRLPKAGWRLVIGRRELPHIRRRLAICSCCLQSVGQSLTPRDRRLQTVGRWFQMVDRRLLTTDMRLQMVDRRLQTSGRRLQTTGRGLQMIDSSFL